MPNPGRRTKPPEPRALRRLAAAMGTLGALAAGAGAFAVPRAAHAQALFGQLPALPPFAVEALRVQPSLGARLTYTDNVRASARNPRSDLIAEVAPAIALSAQAGPLTGDLRARLRNVGYLNESGRGSAYLALHGRGQLEAVPRTLFIDMDAAITHSNRSDFFGRAPGDFLDLSRGNETRLLSLGPRLEFRLGADTRGTLSYMSRWFSGGGALDSRRVDHWRANVGDPSAFGRVGWRLDYNRVDTHYDDAFDSRVHQETARATVFATVSPQLRLRAIAGHESTDYAVAAGERGRIVGGGFDWRPSERTALSGTLEDRVFGRTYHLGLTHRRPRSHWNLTWSRDISSSLQSLYGVFDDPDFRDLYAGLAATIPDPFEREAYVRALLGFTEPGLREGAITKAYFLNRRLRAGVSLIGARNVLSLSAQRSERERLPSVQPLDPLDDFALFSRVRTDSVTLALSHRVSGNASLNASVLHSRARGDGDARAETRRTVLSVGAGKRFSPRSHGSLIYRHQRAEGRTEFSENVVTASIDIRF